MRKRSKPRVVWLPPDPNATLEVEGEATSIGRTGLIFVSPAAQLAAEDHPIVIDIPAAPATSSLSDVENSGYRLRRIVGKIWVEQFQEDDSSVTDVLVTCGFIIRRVDAAGQSIAALQNPPSLNHPALADNIPDPWIWRRSWFLRNNSSPAANPLQPTGPETNQFFAALDGPHIDQKTARRISQEERLFLSIGVVDLGTANDQDQIESGTRVMWDLRVLASMTTSSGNRRNAVR